MKRVVAVAAAVLVSIVLMLILLMFVLLDSESSVQPTQPGTVNEAVRLQRLAKQLYAFHDNIAQQKQFRLHTADMNAALSVIQRASSERFRSRMALNDRYAEAYFSLALSPHRYLNGRVKLLASTQGLNFGPARIGPLRLSGQQFHWFAKHLLNRLLGQNADQWFIDSVESVSLGPDKMIVAIHPKGSLDFKQLLKIKDWLSPISFSDSKRVNLSSVRYYLAELSRFDQQLPAEETYSLAIYLQQLFKRVSERSQQLDPIRENKAAMVALGIFLGDGQIENTLERVTQVLALEPLKTERSVTLSGREDLSRHFSISSALRMFGDAKMSFSMGELKELMDAGAGGSGFSFVDMAANMAGIAFSEKAIHANTADVLQQALQSMGEASESESLFFVSETFLSELPEGLTEHQFSTRFRNTQSEKYLDMIAWIRDQVNTITLHRARD